MVAEAGKETDRERREQLLTALGAFRDPALNTAALELALSGTFDVRETFGLLTVMLSARQTREGTWAYLRDHIDQVADIVPAIARGYLPYMASGFCDEAHRTEAETFFRPRVKAWVGGSRVLDQVLEGIALCAASTERQQPSIREILAAY
jgi:hypothetical protein